MHYSNVTATGVKSPIVSLKDFMATPLEEPPLLIDGLFHQGCKGLLSGGSKSYKTWTLLDMGLSVVSGCPFWGIKTTPGPVLYANFELKKWSIQRRLDKLIESMGLEKVPEGFFLLNLRGATGTAEELVTRILEEVKAKGETFSLIPVDPLYKLMIGKEENTGKDVGPLMREFERLSEETGAAVVMAHHHSKGNQSRKSAMDRASCSGVFARDPDTLIDMVPHTEADCFTVEATLRDLPPKPPFVVRWDFPRFILAPDLNPSETRKQGRGKQYKVQDILAVLPNCGLRHKEWKERVLAQTNISTGTFGNLLTRAKAERLVQQEGNLYLPAQ